jgi:4-alpha-glucanotransferase
MLPALASVAALAIAPLQDLLNLGRKALLNVPGRPEGNWAGVVQKRCCRLLPSVGWGVDRELKPHGASWSVTTEVLRA